MNVQFVLTIANILVAAAGAVVVSKIVLRTEKGLDKVFKLYLCLVLIVFFASIIELNRFFGVLDQNYSNTIFVASRFLAMTSFLVGSVLMLRIINKNMR